MEICKKEVANNNDEVSKFRIGVAIVWLRSVKDNKKCELYYKGT